MTDPLEGFTLTPLTADSPAVLERFKAFCDKIGIQKPWRDERVRWFGLFKDGVCSLVCGIYPRPLDGSVEVMDFFPAPTRDGVRAGYVGMKLLKLLVDEKIFSYFLGGIPAQNNFGRRHAEKFFGITPRAIVYVYEGFGK